MNLAADPATLAFYEAQAAAYAARWTAPSRHLDDFLALLPAGARILELGCGGGRDAAAMLARGFDVDATDGSPALAAMASAALGQPARVMRFDELDAEERYDAVWANASLLHVPRDGLGDVLARIWRALQPGGLHAASFKVGDGEGRDRFGRYYNRLTTEELVAAYEAAGAWTMLDVQRSRDAGYDGTESDWAGLVMRRGPSRE